MALRDEKFEGMRKNYSEGINLMKSTIEGDDCYKYIP